MVDRMIFNRNELEFVITIVIIMVIIAEEAKRSTWISKLITCQMFYLNAETSSNNQKL